MSFITCLGNCKYQKDGYCRLERVSDWNGTASGKNCVYFTASGSAENSRSAEDGENSLPHAFN